METEKVLKKALEGDLAAFQALFVGFQGELRSYLYRLLANRSDAEDLTHDTFIQAFDKLHTFRGEATLKTWVFRIATHLASNYLQRRRRWTVDVSEQAKNLVLNNPAVYQSIVHVAATSPAARYDIQEHIDTCFTCISKNLPIENQVALMLKDVYDFSVKEIMLILDRSEGVVKYLLQDARKTMTTIFDQRCALVSKQGVCHQCSELNGWFNPRQDQQQALMRVKMVRKAEKASSEELYEMRAALVKAIDPLRAEGNELQEILLRCNSMAMGEAEAPE